ncbi:MAG: hypothetical protein JWR48_7315 [Mycobacterium sp.]|nr:hypothetical protein [Mycobacterium sp.]
MVPDEQEDHGQRGRCLADSLIRREPDADDTIAVEKLASTTTALRRLICQVLDIGLPVDPFWRSDGGLGFDLLSSYSAGERVVIGHSGGVITIDLVESLDAHRESMRVRLGEPYRTMLGHFRHEVGHYYQNVLVESGPGALRYLDECRELFGDERADYQAEIARHYRFGAPENWRESYISEYATMHPWEDFAECFAHFGLGSVTVELLHPPFLGSAIIGEIRLWPPSSLGFPTWNATGYGTGCTPRHCAVRWQARACPGGTWR